jgi:hypothetical protein
MAAILGREKYHNAEGSGWAVADKIFGYMDDTVNLYNKLRSGEITQSEYDLALAEKKSQYGIFGMKQPWGAVILIGGVAFVGILIYKIATK